jgi:DNA-directed RNA polymerase specialized sigma24 family protein
VALEETPTALHMAGPEPGPEELLLQDDAERHLEWAFLQLEEGQRALLALRAEGHGLTEIANITGVDKEVLSARLHRARTSLARHLEQPAAAATAVRPRSAS